MAFTAAQLPREDIYGGRKRVRVFREWIETLRVRRGGRALSILDFGCGTGASVTRPLADAGDRVHGVDSHAESIALASGRNPPPNLTFGTESTGDLVARGARFDVVVCSEVLEHTTTPADLLRDFHALLEADGLLFVTVPNGYGTFENLQRVDRLLHRVGVGQVVDHGAWLARAAYWRLRGRGTPPRPGQAPAYTAASPYLNMASTHVQFFRLPELRSLFAAAGFELEASRGRVLVCGPYVDFWSVFFPPFLLRLNDRLADRLPLRWAADWMFRLRRAAGASVPGGA